MSSVKSSFSPVFPPSNHTQDGTLYVADCGNRRVVRVGTEALEVFGEAGGTWRKAWWESPKVGMLLLYTAVNRYSKEQIKLETYICNILQSGTAPTSKGTFKLWIFWYLLWCFFKELDIIELNWSKWGGSKKSCLITGRPQNFWDQGSSRAPNWETWRAGFSARTFSLLHPDQGCPNPIDVVFAETAAGVDSRSEVFRPPELVVFPCRGFTRQTVWKSLQTNSFPQNPELYHSILKGFFRSLKRGKGRDPLTPPGSCLLVSAGNGVYLLDPETKSSLDLWPGWRFSIPGSSPNSSTGEIGIVHEGSILRDTPISPMTSWKPPCFASSRICFDWHFLASWMVTTLGGGWQRFTKHI